MEVNEKAAMVIDHDIYFIDIVSDSLLVFEGEGGVSGKAIGPLPLRTGMNRFLEQVEITFRRLETRVTNQACRTSDQRNRAMSCLLKAT